MTPSRGPRRRDHTPPAAGPGFTLDFPVPGAAGEATASSAASCKPKKAPYEDRTATPAPSGARDPGHGDPRTRGPGDPGSPAAGLRRCPLGVQTPQRRGGRLETQRGCGAAQGPSTHTPHTTAGNHLHDRGRWHCSPAAPLPRYPSAALPSCGRLLRTLPQVKGRASSGQPRPPVAVVTAQRCSHFRLCIREAGGLARKRLVVWF